MILSSQLAFDIRNKIVDHSFIREKIMIKHLSKENLVYFKEIKIKKLQKIFENNLCDEEIHEFVNLSLLRNVKKMIFTSNGIGNDIYWSPRILLNVEELKFINIKFNLGDDFIIQKELPNLKRIIIQGIIPDRFFNNLDYSKIEEIVIIELQQHDILIKNMNLLLDMKVKITIKPRKKHIAKSKNILYIGDSLF